MTHALITHYTIYFTTTLYKGSPNIKLYEENKQTMANLQVQQTETVERINDIVIPNERVKTLRGVYLTVKDSPYYFEYKGDKFYTVSESKVESLRLAFYKIVERKFKRVCTAIGTENYNGLTSDEQLLLIEQLNETIGHLVGNSLTSELIHLHKTHLLKRGFNEEEHYVQFRNEDKMTYRERDKRNSQLFDEVVMEDEDLREQFMKFLEQQNKKG